MSLFWAAGLPILVYLAAFYFYGRWAASAFGLDDARATPACRINDGSDYVPTRPAILLGQHFAAIAAVGPIAGPIIAGMKYGWLPGIIWITLGAVFIGAVHDLAALVISVRHGARTVGEVFREILGPRASLLFSMFIWFSLVYVIVVFTDLTAGAFINRPELGAENFGPGVATSSILYLVLALILGWCWKAFKLPLWASTVLFVPAVFAAIWLGQKIPIVLPGEALAQQKLWDVGILVYCVAASLLPMWLLLQPRGYLGGFILYTTFAAGVIGLLLGGRPIEFPSVAPPPTGGSSGPGLFPLLFTTIACGACSGFHGLVSSGTTSKQLEKESHARIVGYGGMLLESLVAVIAMATVMMLAQGSSELKLGPDEIYARGLAHFMAPFGIPFAAGVTFSKLAFATFIYDTLDVATRLGRYVIQETTGWKDRRGAVLATLGTVAIPLAAILTTFTDASGQPVPLWKIFWPAFGASNQLLAAMTLLGVSVWLKKTNRNYLLTAIPGVFMMIVTLSSLALLVKPWILSIPASGWRWDPIGTTGVALGLIAVAFTAECARGGLRCPLIETAAK